MSMTFTKLFSSITASTIWAARDQTRIVWITMLAMADQHGRVWASIPGLSNIARVPIEACEEALAELMAPDKYSRTKDHDGRRVEEIDGGWRLLNHAKYRAIRDEESIKESKRRYINARRQAERSSTVEPVEQCRTAVERCRANTEAEAEAEVIPSLLTQAPARQTPDGPQLALVDAPKPRAKKVPDCPHQAILALWAEVLPALPQHNPELWNGARADHLRARWRETAASKGWESESEGLTYFRRLFAYIGQSAFLTGKAKPAQGKPPFIAELAWVVSPQSWAKVHEGKYHSEAA